jgi:hypothetical protein
MLERRTALESLSSVEACDGAQGGVNPVYFEMGGLRNSPRVLQGMSTAAMPQAQKGEVTRQDDADPPQKLRIPISTAFSPRTKASEHSWRGGAGRSVKRLFPRPHAPGEACDRSTSPRGVALGGNGVKAICVSAKTAYGAGTTMNDRAGQELQRTPALPRAVVNPPPHRGATG